MSRPATPPRPRGDRAAHRPRTPTSSGSHAAVDAPSVAALIGVQTLFGLHYLAAKSITQVVPPRPWSLIRASSAAVLLFLFAWGRGLPFPRDRRVLLRFAGLGLIGVAINQWLFVEGLFRTSPGHSALINTSMPVLVILIAFALGRERPTARRLVGVGVTILGVLVLIGPERLDWRAEAFRGDILTLINATSYSLFLVLSKPILERERTLPASALLIGFGALWLVPVGLPGLFTLDLSAIPARAWMLGAFIVLGPTVGAYALNTFALRRVASSVVAFFIYLQPLIGAGLSIALGFERPTPRLFGAAFIVFCGVFIALRSPGAPPPPPALAPEP